MEIIRLTQDFKEEQGEKETMKTKYTHLISFWVSQKIVEIIFSALSFSIITQPM